MTNTPIYSISGERAVVSIGGRCPYGCNYCFVNSKGYALLEELPIDKIVDSVASFPPDVKRIELGLDKDPMHDQPAALDLIARLSVMGKDLAFATKAHLTDTTIEQLVEVRRSMASRGNHLFTKVSLMGFETARKYESKAPDPDQRVDTVKRLHKAGLSTIIYVKPIIPNLADEELERVFQETAESCYAYIAGYLIYDEKMARRMGIELSDERMKMEWDPSQKLWYVYRDPRIKELTKRDNVFGVSRDAIEHVKILNPV